MAAAVCVCTSVAAEVSWAQPAPACDATIDAHVVDAATHEPVVAAVVTIAGGAGALTDDAGRAEISAVCPGRVALVVERADYETGRVTAVVRGVATVEVRLRAHPEEIVIEEKAVVPEDTRSTTTVDRPRLEQARGRSFSDAVADVPGVAELETPSGVGKPIVRGQSGRRLLLLVGGVRHRAQDWGVDHAPEIDPFVADRITVVRGAAGVRYGPDAIGGAIIVEPPDLPSRPGTHAELSLVGASNGAGGSVGARVQQRPAALPRLAWQLEGSLRRLAAPSTPDYALDNTGVEEWNVGGTAGLRLGDGDLQLSYNHYQARLGVCSCLRIESRDDFYAQLDRERPIGVEAYDADMTIERPYQAVAHDLAVARGRWRAGAAGTLTARYAFQYDHRREYDVVRDAVTGPQFNFRLYTHDAEVTFEHHPLHLGEHLHLRGSGGVAGMVQTHHYSGLPLVPDHDAVSGSVFATERLVSDRFELEAGLRLDVLARAADIERLDFLRLVRSGQLAADACGMGEPDPVRCESTFSTVSATLGAVRQLGDGFALKADLATTSRPPNPDEQYLNGASPTQPVLGLGKPDLGPETTYAGSLTATLRGERLRGELSVHGSIIDDYITFAPALDENGAPIFDVLIRGTFPRFVTRPVDARFWGVDGGVTLAPWSWLELDLSGSLVRARNLTDDTYLTFVPPDRLRGEATVKGPLLGLDEASLSVAASAVARQGRVDLGADLAPPPPGYVLLDADLGVETRLAGHTMRVGLSGRNLTDRRYRDYTSLLRYFADQPGRQLWLRLTLELASAGAR